MTAAMSRWTVLAGPERGTKFDTYRVRCGPLVATITVSIGSELTDEVCDADWAFAVGQHRAKRQGVAP